jgi:hypothetical protein
MRKFQHLQNFGGFSSSHHVHKMKGLVDDWFRSLSGKAPRQPDARLIAFSQAERISIRSTLVCEESRAGGAVLGLVGFPWIAPLASDHRSNAAGEFPAFNSPPFSPINFLWVCPEEKKFSGLG